MNRTSPNPDQTSNQKLIREFIKISFQSGAPEKVGINGCRVEDVCDVLLDKIHAYQVGALSCVENAEAAHHLDMAKKALLRRRQLRQEQGVLNTPKPHKSLFDNRTEDVDHEFSATGS